jgi:hypothetical protein
MGLEGSSQYHQGLLGLLTGMLLAAVCGVILLVLWRRRLQLETA